MLDIAHRTVRPVKISTILLLPNTRVILHLSRKGEVRYSAISKLITSRGTLSLVLRELEEEGLVHRRVVAESRPIQSHYSLTKKGREVASELARIEDIIKA